VSDGHVLERIASLFRVDGTFVSAERYGTGHINETYLGRYATAEGERRYIHQRINSRIFRDVPALVSNIGRVTRHVRSKLEASGASEIERRVLALIPTLDDEDVLRAEDGSWWRTYAYIDRARTYDTIARSDQAYEAARAFGRFIELLADLPGKRLHETIGAFHDTHGRFARLMRAAENDILGRVKGAGRELDYCMRHEPLADALAALRRAGISRECVTHNDTKLNNVMLDDDSGVGMCVIDLDTVMPGLALFDFGDMVRTAVISVAEDERDVTQVQAQPAMFEAIARGFIEGAGPLLAREEREHLVTAGKVMTFESGLRFLTDYLEGDTYFRIHRPNQNLDRARTQFALIDSLTRQERELRGALT
jgi:hypothetical protein